MKKKLILIGKINFWFKQENIKKIVFFSYKLLFFFYENITLIFRLEQFNTYRLKENGQQAGPLALSG